MLYLPLHHACVFEPTPVLSLSLSSYSHFCFGLVCDLLEVDYFSPFFLRISHPNTTREKIKTQDWICLLKARIQTNQFLLFPTQFCFYTVVFFCSLTLLPAIYMMLLLNYYYYTTTSNKFLL